MSAFATASDNNGLESIPHAAINMSDSERGHNSDHNITGGSSVGVTFLWEFTPSIDNISNSESLTFTQGLSSIAAIAGEMTIAFAIRTPVKSTTNFAAVTDNVEALLAGSQNTFHHRCAGGTSDGMDVIVVIHLESAQRTSRHPHIFSIVVDDDDVIEGMLDSNHCHAAHTFENTVGQIENMELLKTDDSDVLSKVSVTNTQAACIDD